MILLFKLHDDTNGYKRTHIIMLQSEEKCTILQKINNCFTVLSTWTILYFTATTAERFFRIDRSQENLHYITDISSEDLYILDPDMTQKGRTNNNIEGQEDKNAAVVKENNFTSSRENELVFTFSMPVTPPKSPRYEVYSRVLETHS